MNDEAQSPFSQAIVPGSPSPALPDSGGSAERIPDIRLDEPTFKEVFVAWEKLRLVYNGLLLAVVVAIFRETVVIVAPLFLILPAILANVCFCAGPVAEGYLCLIQIPRRFARWFVFGSGCLLGMVVTYVSIKENWIGIPMWP